tara:strand:+ start:294 stop:812 length:519 start_codon:yes stop_codon:yes gene_type:complete
LDTDYLYGITYELGDEEMNEEEIKNKEIDPQLWEHMKDNIKQSFREQNNNFESEHFHNVIWHVSHDLLNEKEVSVIVDRDDNLFIGKGTRSFVDYKDESVKGMKIPLKCWIHTHPFGQAYFSGTDWFTINTQKPILDSAIVLGDHEKMKWYKLNGKEQLCKIQMIELDDSEE